jgi:hypothetical protein
LGDFEDPRPNASERHVINRKLTGRGTKNGLDVTAALNPTAAAMLCDYVKWRGKLHERETPLFLTFRCKPYVDNGRSAGGQNKTAFAAAKRRARKAIVLAAIEEARRLRAGGAVRPPRPSSIRPRPTPT